MTDATLTLSMPPALPPPNELCPIATPDVAAVVKKVREIVGLVNEEEMAAILQVSYATLATWRTRRKGPPSIKLGKKVFYAVGDFDNWVQEEVQRQRVPLCPPLRQQKQAETHVHY